MMEPWEEEPDRLDFEAHGLKCAMQRNPRSLAWCGYVAVDKGHPWHGKDYSDLDDESLSVHGDELTFSGDYLPTHKPEPGVWWFGFDCSHLGDFIPGVAPMFQFSEDDAIYRDAVYVRAECEHLAEQLAHWA